MSGTSGILNPLPSPLNAKTSPSTGLGSTSTLPTLPSRRYSISSLSPASTPSMKSSSLRVASSASLALNDSSLIDVIMSPARSPASLAALPGVTPRTRTPSTGPSSSPPIVTPSRGRALPNSSKRRSIRCNCGSRADVNSAICRAAWAIAFSASNIRRVISASRVSRASARLSSLLCAAAWPTNIKTAATGNTSFQIFMFSIS